MPQISTDVVELLRERAHSLRDEPRDYTPVLDRIGNVRLVLIGEASHGTHEFYRERAQLTKLLIEQKQFTAVAVEADWPDAYRVNRYVRGAGPGLSALDALGGFRRFPQWMWRNADVLDFVGWLRDFNDAAAPVHKVGFYGLDLYSLFSSIDAVLQYLDKIDPGAAKRARYRYGCFEQFHENSQAYGYAASIDLSRSCEDEVVAQLAELQRRASDYVSRDGRVAADEFFYAQQNAQLVRNAEAYYREMFASNVSSWNLRDKHMTQTLDALLAHLEKQHSPAKIVVWAHNSHLGDARATELGEGGELNVGQLARQRYDGDTVLIGLTTYTGTVTAASDWDGPAERKRVRPALRDSYEALLHGVGIPRFALVCDESDELASALRERRLERAIGVIYLPETERLSHYFQARLSDQFDIVLHFDATRAIEPLERTPEWQRGEVEETFPTGL
jgi:erythromycin esterase-like protein